MVKKKNVKDHSLESHVTVTSLMLGKKRSIEHGKETTGPIPAVPTAPNTPNNFLPPWPIWDEARDNPEHIHGRANKALFSDPYNDFAFVEPLIPFCWKRPSEHFESQPNILENEYLTNIIIPNAYLIEKCGVLRRMLTEISELMDFAAEAKFKVEGENQAFRSVRKGSWKPWHHVYGTHRNLKSEGVPNRSLNGKYLIRLYYMGAWRSIAVDDNIPFLPDGKYALPLTQDGEIWLMLLIKGLLKVYYASDHSNYSTVTALTGWIFEPIQPDLPVEVQRLWANLTRILPRYALHDSKKQSVDIEEVQKSSPSPPNPDLDTVSYKNKLSLSSKKGDNNNRNSIAKSLPEYDVFTDSLKSLFRDQGEFYSNRFDLEETGSERNNQFPSHRKKTKAKQTAKDLKNALSSATRHSTGSSAPSERSVMSKVAGKAVILAESVATIDFSKPEETNEPGQNNYKKIWEQLHSPKNLPSVTKVSKKLFDYAGTLSSSDPIVLNYQRSLGKAVPVFVTSTFKDFPVTAFNIPNHLYHPVNLVETKDSSVMYKDPENRPRTPLWKKFRWKSWAMAKGIIPYEQTGDEIRSVRLRTPFTNSYDWRIASSEKSSFQIANMVPPPPPPTQTTSIEGIDSSINSMSKASETTIKSSVRASSAASKSTKLSTLSRNESLVQQIDPKKEKGKERQSAAVNRSVSEPRKSSIMSRDRSLASVKAPLPVSASSAAVVKKSTLKPETPESVQNYEPNVPSDDPNVIPSSKEQNPSRCVPLRDLKIAREDYYQQIEDAETSPKSCGNFWLNADRFAVCIEKFQYYFDTASPFGACVVLQGKAEKNRIKTMKDFPQEKEITSCDLENYHNAPNSLNLSISYSPWKVVKIMPLHLMLNAGLDGAFYLYNWTVQELIFNLDFNAKIGRKQFLQHTKTKEDISDTASKTSKEEVLIDSILLVLEPWDWRMQDTFETPIIVASAESNLQVQLSLPPGRHTFRLWLIPQCSNTDLKWLASIPLRKSENENSHNADFDDLNEPTLFDQIIRNALNNNLFLKICSKAPFDIGSRHDVENYLTNAPVLLLKQCELINENLWDLLYQFSTDKFRYMNSLIKLRESYCPMIPDYCNNMTEKQAEVHAHFQDHVLDSLSKLTEGKFDSEMLLTLRTLFLNPFLGSYSDSIKESPKYDWEHVVVDIENSLGHDRKRTAELVSKAQLLFKKWIQEKVLDYQNKHRDIQEILGSGLKKIAFLLSQYSDSFNINADLESVVPPDFEDAGETDFEPEERQDMNHHPLAHNVIAPKPPKWIVNTVMNLLTAHKWMRPYYPHAYCLPHHVKIREVKGILPCVTEKLNFLPFFLQTFHVIGKNDDAVSFCCFELSTENMNCREKLFLTIIDNDTLEHLTSNMELKQKFEGTIKKNTNGYTLLCYRKCQSVLSDVEAGSNSANISNYWLLRVITENTRSPFQFVDTSYEEMQLYLNRAAGYYLPNEDFLLCRFTLEPLERDFTAFIRFTTNYPDVILRIHIWNITKEELVIHHKGKGSILIPNLKFDQKRSSKPFASGKVNFESQKPSRYSISIFVEENSWPLTPPEWEFVQKEKVEYAQALKKYLEKKKKKRRDSELRQLKRLKSNPNIGLKEKRDTKTGKTVSTPNLLDVLDPYIEKSKVKSKTEAKKENDQTGSGSTSSKGKKKAAILSSKDKLGGKSEKKVPEGGKVQQKLSKVSYRSVNLSVVGHPLSVPKPEQPHWFFDLISQLGQSYTLKRERLFLPQDKNVEENDDNDENCTEEYLQKEPLHSKTKINFNFLTGLMPKRATIIARMVETPPPKGKELCRLAKAFRHKITQLEKANRVEKCLRAKTLLKLRVAQGILRETQELRALVMSMRSLHTSKEIEARANDIYGRIVAKTRAFLQSEEVKFIPIEYLTQGNFLHHEKQQLTPKAKAELAQRLGTGLYQLSERERMNSELYGGRWDKTMMQNDFKANRRSSVSNDSSFTQLFTDIGRHFTEIAKNVSDLDSKTIRKIFVRKPSIPMWQEQIRYFVGIEPKAASDMLLNWAYETLVLPLGSVYNFDQSSLRNVWVYTEKISDEDLITDPVLNGRLHKPPMNFHIDQFQKEMDSLKSFVETSIHDKQMFKVEKECARWPWFIQELYFKYLHFGFPNAGAKWKAIHEKMHELIKKLRSEIKERQKNAKHIRHNRYCYWVDALTSDDEVGFSGKKISYGSERSKSSDSAVEKVIRPDQLEPSKKKRWKSEDWDAEAESRLYRFSDSASIVGCREEEEAEDELHETEVGCCFERTDVKQNDIEEIEEDQMKREPSSPTTDPGDESSGHFDLMDTEQLESPVSPVDN